MPHPLTNAFGQIVRRRREAAKLSQEELAERANLSRQDVGMIERDETNPTLLAIHDVARALGTTMGSLIAELEETSATADGK